MTRENVTPKIEFANTLRGIAALCVLCSHYFWQFWDTRHEIAFYTGTPVLDNNLFPTPGYLTAFNAALPGIGGFMGHFGVGLFFLISGFVIPFSFQHMDWKGFFIARLWRIYPTYVAGVTLSLLAIGLGSLYFQTPFAIEPSRIFFCYFPGFLQLASVIPIDSVVWTLEIEIRFYLLCMLVSPFLQRGSVKAFVAPVVLFALAVLSSQFFDAPGMNKYLHRVMAILTSNTPLLSFMFVGVAVNYYYRKKIPFYAFVMLAALCLGIFGASLFLNGAVAMFAGEKGVPPHTPQNVAETYSIALYFFLIAYFNRSHFRKNIVSDFFADISYPLYINHQITGYILLRILVPLGYPPLLTVAAVMIMIIVLAWLIHVAIEAPTHRIGRKLAAKMRPKHSEAVS